MQKVLNQNWCNEYRKPFQLTMAPWQSRYEHIMEVLKRKEIYCRNVCILGTYMYIALLLQHMVIYFSGKNTKINQSTSNCNIKFSLRWVFIILNNFNLAWIQLNVYCCFCWNLFNIWMYQIPKGKMYQSYLIWQDTIGL